MSGPSREKGGGETSEKMETEDEEDWEYYDDSTVLTAFWQIFVDEERNFARCSCFSYFLYCLSASYYLYFSYLTRLVSTPTHRPVDVWLKHFIKPYQNCYGWNIFKEYWRVWVPLLLAPR